MCPRKAAFAAGELLKTPKVIGCHFDTFPPITINHDSAMKHFEEKMWSWFYRNWVRNLNFKK